METMLISGATVAYFDDQVIAALKTVGHKISGKPSSVAIRNEHGDIYRLASPLGIWELKQTCEVLEAVGLIDELEDDHRANRYDAIYRLP